MVGVKRPLQALAVLMTVLGTLAVAEAATREAAPMRTPSPRPGVIDVGLPGTRMIVSQSAPRAGGIFVSTVLVVGDEARRLYTSVRFPCDAAYGSADRRTLRRLTRATTGLTSGPEPQTVVCAWHIPPGSVGKTLHSGWSWTVARVDRTGAHADGSIFTWRIRD